jgi:flagella basal body P-ring formation protein FlgA
MSNRITAWVLVAASGLALPGLVRADEPTSGGRPVATERFVPRTGTLTCGAGKMEIHSSATSSTNEITLKQLCGWSEADADAFAPVADLVVDRFDGAESTHVVSMLTIKTTLRQAGVNIGNISFKGSTECVVARGLAIDTADKPVTVDTKEAAAPAVVPAAERLAPAGEAATPFHSLKDRLTEDLSQRLNIPIDRLEVSFSNKDTNTLNLAEPTFHFDIEPRHVHDLGRVTWDVTVTTGNNKEKVTIAADARAWENELIVGRPIASGQVITERDVTEQKVLLDQLPMDTLLTKSQAVGEQSSRQLSPGAVLTGRLIEAVEMARSGQSVSVTLNQGSVQATNSVIAIESGTLGQTIRVRNPETREVYEVTLTGKQQAVVGDSPAADSVAAVAAAK